MLGTSKYFRCIPIISDNLIPEHIHTYLGIFHIINFKLQKMEETETNVSLNI